MEAAASRHVGSAGLVAVPLVIGALDVDSSKGMNESPATIGSVELVVPIMATSVD